MGCSICYTHAITKDGRGECKIQRLYLMTNKVQISAWSSVLSHVYLDQQPVKFAPSAAMAAPQQYKNAVHTQGVAVPAVIEVAA